MPERTVAQYMSPHVEHFVAGRDNLRTVVEIIVLRRKRHVPVLSKDGHFVGIVTDRDVKRILPSPLLAPPKKDYEALLDTTSVDRIMTRDPISVAPNTPLREAVELLNANRIGGLPVIEGDKLVGLFTATDALRALAELLSIEAGELPAQDTATGSAVDASR